MADYKEPKVFIGKVKTFNHQQYGLKIKLSFNRDHIKLMESRMNASGWMSVVLHTNKNGVWYAEVDTWKPQMQQIPEANQARFQEPPQEPRYGQDDLPPQNGEGIPF